jgi:mono/diheme cytochrome c family protein
MFIRIMNALTLVAIFTTLCGAYQATVQKVPAKPADPSSGKAMFTEYCASCHGESGTGNGPAASALKKTPADLTQLSVRNDGKFPEAKVSRFIKGDDLVAAHGSRDMPIWGAVFRSMRTADDEIWALRVYNLTNYVKSIQVK